jgi:hypothetical protein
MDAAAQRGDSPALAQILSAQARRNERSLNVFRAPIWARVGLITGGAEPVANASVSPGAALALAWGGFAAASGLTWMRHRHRAWVAPLLTTVDVTGSRCAWTPATTTCCATTRPWSGTSWSLRASC